MPAIVLGRPRRGVRAAVAVLAVTCLTLAGCANDGDVPTGAREASAGVGEASSPRSEITVDITGAVEAVEHYWTAEFAAIGGSFRPVRRVYAYTPNDGTTCGGEPNVPRNAVYCRPSDEIALDIQWAARAYRALGDAFVYYLIGHEYAHAVQRRLGTSLDFTIEYELQADCYAGASIGDQVRAGVLQLEDGDIEELRTGLRAVADPEGTPWFDPRAHGTAEQRIRFFGVGFDDSLEACP